MKTKEEEIKYLVDFEMKATLNVPETVRRSFEAGAAWAEKNKEKSKVRCLRDSTKTCNLCHDCDIYVLNPNY
ncbi:hypothetical protein [Parabacteroides chongii]|uniref:hypothetical protein n=1 Tax=Parabacteroides chongii TaxID=2685834 RepID=UPI00240E880C|nr:hypothetical protein [Parabacteroides chongii]WFE84946.1 hypothetical protein P3L47_22980 [Parabacteroides chongii]